jgi:hypothetical protein
MEESGEKLLETLFVKSSRLKRILSPFVQDIVSHSRRDKPFGSDLEYIQFIENAFVMQKYIFQLEETIWAEEFKLQTPSFNMTEAADLIEAFARVKKYLEGLIEDK